MVIKESIDAGGAMGSKKLKTGEVIIDENLCLGCGYCVMACKRGCLEITGDTMSTKGFLLPILSKPDECNACGSCAVMCPTLAIEVYAVTIKEG